MMDILNPSGSLPQLQDQCKALNLPITYTEEVTIEGWYNKPKGSLQIMFERGWIDPDKWKDYTENGKMDEMGNLREDTSIKLLLQKQPDFIAELTLLQYYGQEMGVLVDRTPKCHPEMAGDGVEYVWALAKLYYRHQPLSRKRSKEKFRKLVDEALSVKNISLEKTRKCSKRARRYMLAYEAIAKIQKDSNVESSINHEYIHKKEDKKQFETLTHINYDLIEKSIKAFKTHRNASDFDHCFIKQLSKDEEKFGMIKKIVLKMKSSG